MRRGSRGMCCLRSAPVCAGDGGDFRHSAESHQVVFWNRMRFRSGNSDPASIAACTTSTSRRCACSSPSATTATSRAPPSRSTSSRRRSASASRSSRATSARRSWCARGAASSRRRPGIALLEHARTVLFTMERIAQRRRVVQQRASRATCGWSRPSRRSPNRCSTTSRRSCASRPIATSRSTSRSASRTIWCASLREGGASVGVCWDNVDFAAASSTGPTATTSSRSRSIADHPLAGRKSLRFEQTLRPRARRPAADDRGAHRCCSAPRPRVGRVVSYRVDRVELRRRVPGRRGQPRRSASIPAEVGGPVAAMLGIKVIPLTDAWAQRRFAVCFQTFEALQPPARRLVDHLVERAAAAGPP